MRVLSDEDVGGDQMEEIILNNKKKKLRWVYVVVVIGE